MTDPTADRHAVDYGRPGTHLAALAAAIADINRTRDEVIANNRTQRETIERLAAERDQSHRDYELAEARATAAESECLRLTRERDKSRDLVARIEAATSLGAVAERMEEQRQTIESLTMKRDLLVAENKALAEDAAFVGSENRKAAELINKEHARLEEARREVGRTVLALHEVTGERDRARDLAARLEAELATIRPECLRLARERSQASE